LAANEAAEGGMMYNNKPGRGFIGTLNWLVRRLCCPHARTFTMYPENVHWHRNGKHNALHRYQWPQ
jgi:hypothetical protein